LVAASNAAVAAAAAAAAAAALDTSELRCLPQSMIRIGAPSSLFFILRSRPYLPFFFFFSRAHLLFIYLFIFFFFFFFDKSVGRYTLITLDF
jgi:hypothetical protein